MWALKKRRKKGTRTSTEASGVKRTERSEPERETVSSTEGLVGVRPCPVYTLRLPDRIDEKTRTEEEQGF